MGRRAIIIPVTFSNVVEGGTERSCEAESLDMAQDYDHSLHSDMGELVNRRVGIVALNARRVALVVNQEMGHSRSGRCYRRLPFLGRRSSASVAKLGLLGHVPEGPPVPPLRRRRVA